MSTSTTSKGSKEGSPGDNNAASSDKCHTASNPRKSNATHTAQSDNNVNNNNNTNVNETTPTLLTTRETRTLRRVRLLFVAVLLLSAVATGLAVFWFLQSSERDEFRVKTQEFSDKVLDAVGVSIDQTMAALDVFSFGVSSASPGNNFVTVSDFSQRCDKFFRASKALHLILYVQTQNATEWEAYAEENKGWVDDVIANQRAPKNVVLEPFNTPTQIVDADPRDNNTLGDGPHLVAWQSAPILPNYHFYRFPLYNYDMYTFPVFSKTVLDNMLATGKALLQDTYAPSGLNDTYSQWVGFIRPEQKDHVHPVTNIVYPVAVRSTNRTTTTEYNNALHIRFYWKDWIRHILPEGTGQLYLVVESPCIFRAAEQIGSFTYIIQGPDVKYLGDGDQHDPRYDDMKQTRTLTELEKQFLELSNHDGVGLTLNEEHCSYTLSVFPTEDLETKYRSSQPIAFACTIVVVFLVTSAFFVLYDWFVERRQRVVVVSALQSAANETLLEEQVQERTRRLEKTNRQLEAANRQVVKASEAQLHHFACMSHEIRTPLNCIIGCSGLLKDTVLDPSQAESVEMINSSGDLLLSVVNDVLDYSRLESGNVEIDIKRTSLQHVLDSVVWTMKAKAASQDLRLCTEFSVDLPEYINTDHRRLQQILYNLLGNAVKFGQGGRTVELHVSLSEQTFEIEENDAETYSPPVDDENLSTSFIQNEDTKWARFMVKDYGKGIDPKDFAKIFMAFQQETGDTEIIYGGSGLGLAITTKLVHRMGGTISVRSQVADGAAFVVCLPVTVHPDESFNQSLAVLRDHQVLLLTKDVESREHSRAIFQHFGLSLSSADNLHELENAVGDGKPPVFLVHDEALAKPLVVEQLKDKHVCSVYTFGKAHHLKHVTDGHFRNPYHLLPTVLLRTLSRYITGGTNNDPVRRFSLMDSSIHQIAYDRLRMLIAEDNIVNQKVLCRMLKRLGVEHVKIVGNGKKAVDMEAMEPFDFVLMDMQMPVMDGIEACRHIQRRAENGSHKRAKVVFVTAHAMHDFEDKCWEAGGFEFLTKPCNTERINLCFQRIYRKDPSLFPRQ